MLKDEYSKLNHIELMTLVYPSNEEQRQDYLIFQFRKKPCIKRDNFTRFTKTGAIPYDKTKKKPDLWQDVIEKSMNPQKRPIE